MTLLLIGDDLSSGGAGGRSLAMTACQAYGGQGQRAGSAPGVVPVGGVAVADRIVSQVSAAAEARRAAVALPGARLQLWRMSRPAADDWQPAPDRRRT